MFSIKVYTAAAIAVAGLFPVLTATPAQAESIAIVNASFEVVNPATAFASCGAGCGYSQAPIAGWIGGSGQFQPGPASGNFTFYNSVPDGLTIAYVLSNPLTQTVAATAIAGATYTLTTLIGYRKDTPSDGSAELIVGNNVVAASGTTAFFSGNWSLFTASYTATAADAGAAISIRLSGNSLGTGQGSFDKVTLDVTGSTVPEPATWTLMLVGVGAAGTALRRRRSTPLQSKGTLS